jgi:uncharacterized protein
MVIDNGLLDAKVTHTRISPIYKYFVYKLFYICVPIYKLNQCENIKLLSLNRFNLFSLYEKDYGVSRSKAFHGWVEKVIKSFNCKFTPSDITLITLPRILGHAFNPISFWCCLDKKQNLKAVLCEVNNTFGERHCYLCIKKNDETINSQDWITSDKVFHVSPFFDVKGYYQFRFDIKDSKIGIWIRYFEDEKLLFTTSLIGKRKHLNNKSLFISFVSRPLNTAKVLFLIHFHALHLFLKGIKYRKKPQLPNKDITP